MIFFTTSIYTSLISIHYTW